MGSVYLAQQNEPVKRRVALKLTRTEVADGEAQQAAFLAERQAMAMLSHKDIAQVYDAGTTDQGHSFFVMEYADGLPLDKFCDQHRMTVEQRVALVKRVCDAIHHAHQNNIVHRDIKPSNILAKRDGTNTSLFVIDFGVAKALGDTKLTHETLATQMGQLVGTPAYMSPEQADARNSVVDARADIYALGVLLCKVLVGTTPLEATARPDSSISEVIQQVCTVEPPRPSAVYKSLATKQQTTVATDRSTTIENLSAVLRGGLDWIALKAMRIDVHARYATAEAFGDDLGRFLNHEVVEAVAPSLVYRLRTFYRRNRVASLAASVVAMAALTTFMGFIQTHRETERKQAQLEQRVVALLDQAAHVQQLAVSESTMTIQQWQEAAAAVEQAANLYETSPRRK